MANKMRVQRTSNGQFIVTIPRAFAEALGFKKGTVLEFKFNERGDIVIKKL
jgi:bifunctional DNA-binding transcriptional regulator/antitoxin component of YhaV-PrlF toxin-antitoxin module